MRRGRGRAVLVVVGGAREATFSGNQILLHRRKGFFELALKTGSCLVPVRDRLRLERKSVKRSFFNSALLESLAACGVASSGCVKVYSLGENSMYQRPPEDDLAGRVVKAVSAFCLKVFGFSVPYCCGKWTGKRQCSSDCRSS